MLVRPLAASDRIDVGMDIQAVVSNKADARCIGFNEWLMANRNEASLVC
jgi:hypothetical protein